MSTLQDRIVRNPAILAGKPVIRGTRISVEHIIGCMAGGWSESDIIESYPHITHDDVAACLQYAHDLIQSDRVSPAA